MIAELHNTSGHVHVYVCNMTWYDETMKTHVPVPVLKSAPTVFILLVSLIALSKGYTCIRVRCTICHLVSEFKYSEKPFRYQWKMIFKRCRDFHLVSRRVGTVKKCIFGAIFILIFFSSQIFFKIGINVEIPRRSFEEFFQIFWPFSMILKQVLKSLRRVVGLHFKAGQVIRST